MRLERGNFIHESSVGCESHFVLRYGLRLVFDQSPFPTIEGLANDPDGHWRLKERAAFYGSRKICVGRSLPDSARKVPAMNDGSYKMLFSSCYRALTEPVPVTLPRAGTRYTPDSEPEKADKREKSLDSSSSVAS